MTRAPRSLISSVLVAAGLGVSAVAVVGMALTASATPMLGVVLHSGGTQTVQPAASDGQPGDVDTYEEALDRPFDPLTHDARAVIDTDRERAVFAELQNTCMADAGFDWWDSAAIDPSWVEGASVDERAAVYQALHGSGQTGAYDWQKGGCFGLALHKTGNDANR